MSGSTAIPPGRAPGPAPEYSRPAISPWTDEQWRRFEQACRSGVLANVAELVDTGPRTPEYLTRGLCAAIYHKNIEIVECLLNRGATIDRSIPTAAAWVRSLPIFELLLEHGWDINAPVMGAGTTLMQVQQDAAIMLKNL